MSPETLFNLVNGFSSNQKSTFTKWVNGNVHGGPKPPKFLILFKRMASMSEFDEMKIRKKHFEKSGDFYRNREWLLERIVLCFSQQELNSGADFLLIQTALKFGAIEMAKRLFKEEADRGKQNLDFAHLLKLLIFSHQTLEDQNIQLAGEAVLPSFSFLQEGVETEYQGLQLLRETRLVLRKSQAVREQMAERIQSFINDSRFAPFHHSILDFKLKVQEKVLKDDFETAHIIQKQLVGGLLEGEIKGGEAQKIDALSSAISFSIRQKDRDSAFFYSIQLSKLKVDSVDLVRRRNRMSTLRTIETGIVFGDQYFLNQGSKSLIEEKHDGFSDAEFAYFLYASSYGLLSVGDIEAGFRLIQHLQNSPQSVRKYLPWQIDILQMVFLFEKGDWDFIEDTMDSKRRKFRGMPFPTIILKVIQELYLSSGIVRDDLWNKTETDLSGIAPDKVSSRDFKMFDLKAYLKAKRDGTRLFEALDNDGIPIGNSIAV